MEKPVPSVFLRAIPVIGLLLYSNAIALWGSRVEQTPELSFVLGGA
jgi:hypothetical protein